MNDDLRNRLEGLYFQNLLNSVLIFIILILLIVFLSVSSHENTSDKLNKSLELNNKALELKIKSIELNNKLLKLNKEYK